MNRGAVVEVVDAVEVKGSRVLADFKASRERERHQARLAAEQKKLLEDLRAGQRWHHQVGRLPVRLLAKQHQGAFAVVAGERYFGAAEVDRFTTSWVNGNTSINADLEQALASMRSRSRNWLVNTDLGRRYGQLVEENLVGANAPRLQVRATLQDGVTLDDVANKAIEAHFATWCRKHCDISGRLTLAEICRTNVLAAARDGEFISKRIRDKRLPYGFALQLLDIDRLPVNSSVHGALSGGKGNVIRMGVEIDDLGRPVAYHLASQHPSDSMAGAVPGAKVERVPAGDVFHCFVTKRAEQVRGYPWTAAVLKRAEMLDDYERFGLVAAEIGAAKMGFYVVDKDAPSGDDAPSYADYKTATGQLAQQIEAGMLEALPPGVTFEQFNPDYPHQNFDPFVTLFQRGIAAGLGVAHHNLSGNMTSVTYSSARIAELQERDHWRSMQRWYIDTFLRPVFEEWLRCALLQGAITLPGGAPLPAERWAKFAEAASFQPRSWSWVDPDADIKAAATAIDRDLRSVRQVADEQAVDLDEVLADRKAYLDKCAALGIDPYKVQAPAPTAKPAGAAA